ncbi:MAG: outer membrane protein assembly factor BamA [Pseudomonadota bacterium]|nr:outer membrane protein assembly factor BamA [Pseudomonadota bacterium]
MRNKFFYLKKILIIFTIKLILTHNSIADVIKDFKIDGNNRVSNQTIIMFSNLNIGDNADNDILNEALKDLYYTDYFKEVSISFDNGLLNIKVEENPIIQSVIVNGIKSNRINEKIRDVTLKIEKYPFVENKINEQVRLINNILKSNGYYFVDIKTSIKKNENNTVNLTYDVELGEIAKIKKINFIGDKRFRDNSLRNVIISEESKFWKFITNNKFLDTNRISADVSRLENYYKNRGYYNAIIKSTTGIITDENQFELTFNINAGNKFFFNNVEIINNNDYPIESVVVFQEKFNDLKGKKYSKKVVNNLVNDLNEFILRNDFTFVNATYKEQIIDDNKIDIIINFDDLEKAFVERINIFGNFITDEKVIRNSLIVDEGDAFNEVLFNKSIQKVKAKNIFKTVEYKTQSKDNLNKIIDITVEEKATGEIFAGAGTGTTGSSLTAGLKENNYLGLGIKLDTNLVLTEDSIKGKFSILNPNYNNSDKSIKTSLESSTADFMSTAGYKTKRTGFSIGTEFEQMDNLFVNLDISNFYEDLETTDSATNIVKKQEGNYIENLLKYSIKLNKLNQDFQPTDGYINNFSQTLPIYSDDLAIENSLTGSLYHSLGDNVVLSASYFLKTINSLEDNVRISKRVFVPSRRLRGFESGKIGPKDGTQYIGGNYASALNLSSTFPNIIFEKENIDLNFFLDMANVWEVDYNSSLDSSKIRSSTGIAINWFSGIGPLSFSYAIPLSEADSDVTEKFRFQIGTSF